MRRSQRDHSALSVLGYSLGDLARFAMPSSFSRRWLKYGLTCLFQDLIADAGVGGKGDCGEVDVDRARRRRAVLTMVSFQLYLVGCMQLPSLLTK